MAKRSSELAGEGTALKPKKMVGKMKVQGNIRFPILDVVTKKKMEFDHSDV